MTVPYKDTIAKFTKNRTFHLFLITSLATCILLSFSYLTLSKFHTQQNTPKIEENHWLLLHRKSNIEYLYYGVPGDSKRSTLIKEFHVKTGVPSERPTPLPQLLGREYWRIMDKVDSSDNPETAPFFLTLDIPVSDKEPYGPTPYKECQGSSTAGEGGQCNWELPGFFGLHGVAGDPSRLSQEAVGSSGCVRHADEDITYLYNLLDPKNEEIRYYIQDI